MKLGDSFEAITDHDGIARFTNVPVGSYLLHPVLDAGASGQLLEISPEADAENMLKFYLAEYIAR